LAKRRIDLLARRFRNLAQKPISTQPFAHGNR